MKKRDYVKQVFYDSTGIIQNEDIGVELRDEEIDIIADLLSGKKVNDEPNNPKIDIIFESHLLELKKSMEKKNIKEAITHIKNVLRYSFQLWEK